jgi:hypothetical protein
VFVGVVEDQRTGLPPVSCSCPTRMAIRSRGSGISRPRCRRSTPL